MRGAVLRPPHFQEGEGGSHWSRTRRQQRDDFQQVRFTWAAQTGVKDRAKGQAGAAHAGTRGVHGPPPAGGATGGFLPRGNEGGRGQLRGQQGPTPAVGHPNHRPGPIRLPAHGHRQGPSGLRAAATVPYLYHRPQCPQAKASRPMQGFHHDQLTFKINVSLALNPISGGEFREAVSTDPN